VKKGLTLSEKKILSKVDIDGITIYQSEATGSSLTKVGSVTLKGQMTYYFYFPSMLTLLIY